MNETNEKVARLTAVAGVALDARTESTLLRRVRDECLRGAQLLDMPLPELLYRFGYGSSTFFASSSIRKTSHCELCRFQGRQRTKRTVCARGCRTRYAGYGVRLCRLRWWVLFRNGGRGCEYDDVIRRCRSQEAQLPHALRCPLSHRALCSPTRAADGLTYDRAALHEWFLAAGECASSPIRLSTYRAELTDARCRRRGVGVVRAASAQRAPRAQSSGTSHAAHALRHADYAR